MRLEKFRRWVTKSKDSGCTEASTPCQQPQDLWSWTTSFLGSLKYLQYKSSQYHIPSWLPLLLQTMYISPSITFKRGHIDNYHRRSTSMASFQQICITWNIDFDLILLASWASHHQVITRKGYEVNHPCNSSSKTLLINTSSIGHGSWSHHHLKTSLVSLNHKCLHVFHRCKLTFNISCIILSFSWINSLTLKCTNNH